MNFTQLKEYAATCDNVHFIFTNSIGTTLHGQWTDSEHFTIQESPTPGLINADQWEDLGGNQLVYLPIPEKENPS
jgi:hypothetical protein